ncbi:MAG: hypothetical protein JWN10_458 [Solirubrobacterales bacterium]|nr:hypothetical protein [Solirubrobacterales bacterium]
MVPLASSTALGILGGVIGLSLLCLWWLLRAESRDADEEEAAECAESDAAREALEKELSPR